MMRATSENRAHGHIGSSHPDPAGTPRSGPAVSRIRSLSLAPEPWSHGTLDPEQHAGQTSHPVPIPPLKAITTSRYTAAIRSRLRVAHRQSLGSHTTHGRGAAATAAHTADPSSVSGPQVLHGSTINADRRIRRLGFVVADAWTAWRGRGSRFWQLAGPVAGGRRAERGGSATQAGRPAVRQIRTSRANFFSFYVCR